MMKKYLATASIALLIGCASSEQEERVRKLEEDYSALHHTMEMLQTELTRSNQTVADIASTIAPKHQYLEGNK